MKKKRGLLRLFLGLILGVTLIFLSGSMLAHRAAKTISKGAAANLEERQKAIESLSKRRELSGLPLDLSRGSREGVERSTRLLRAWMDREAWVDGLWVFGGPGNPRLLALHRQETNQGLASFELSNTSLSTIESASWVQGRDGSYLVFHQDIPGLFSPVGHLAVLCQPWRGASLFPPVVLPGPTGSALFFSFSWPGGKSMQGGGQGGWHFLQSVLFSGRTLWVDTVIPYWAVFALLLLPPLLFWWLPMGKTPKNRRRTTGPAPVKSPGGPHEMAPTLRHMQKNVEHILRRLNRGDLERRLGGAGYRHLAQGGRGAPPKSPEEIAKEEALYAGLKLPDGKKTALIEDPTVPVEVVFDFDLGERFDEVVFDMHAAELEKEKEKSDPHKDDFAEGKTKLVQDGEPSRIVFDDTLSGHTDEIAWGQDT